MIPQPHWHAATANGLLVLTCPRCFLVTRFRHFGRAQTHQREHICPTQPSRAAALEILATLPPEDPEIAHQRLLDAAADASQWSRTKGTAA